MSADRTINDESESNPSTDVVELEDNFNNTSADNPYHDEVDQLEDQYNTPDYYNDSNSSKAFSGFRLLKIIGGKKVALALTFVVVIIAIIFFIIFILSSQKLTSYAEDIVTYRLARSAMDYSKTTADIDAEKVAINQTETDASVGTYEAIKDAYGGVRDATWGKLDQYRPNVLYKNMKADGTLKYETTTEKNFLGADVEKITGVTIGDTSIDMPTYSLLHPIQSYIAKRDFANAIQDAVNNQFDGALPLVRGQIGAKIREDVGANLFGISSFGRDYTGKTPAQADQLLEEQLESAESSGPSANASVTEALENATNNTENAIKNCVSSIECAQELVEGQEGNTPIAIKQAINQVDSAGFGQSLVKLANPLYAVALPACIIFDGSLDHSGTDIDTAMANNERSFYFLESVSDQTKTGNITSEANGAINRKLGNGGSVVDEYANDQSPDTSSVKSPESSAGGEYTLLNVELGTGPIQSLLNDTANSFCSSLTNVKLMGGLAIGILAAQIAASFGTSTLLDVGDDTVAARLTYAISDVMNQAWSNLASPFATIKGSFGFMAKFGGLLIATGAADKVSEMAKIIVLSKASLVNDGVTSNNGDFINDADMGGDITNNELERQQLYGAPMNDQNISKNDQSAIGFLNNQEKQKTMMDRYFAISDPRSLISKITFQIASIKDIGIESLFYNALSKVSLSSFSDIFSLSLMNKFAMASSSDTSVSQHYGIVQWGWTDSENNLIESNSSYGVLANAADVTDTQNESNITQIENIYGHCFTDSIGTLLSKGYIIRNSDGDVTNDGGITACSPQNLGPYNPKFGDLVFRWRLYNERNAVLDQNISMQNPTTSSNNTTQINSTTTGN